MRPMKLQTSPTGQDGAIAAPSVDAAIWAWYVDFMTYRELTGSLMPMPDELRALADNFIKD